MGNIRKVAKTSAEVKSWVSKYPHYEAYLKFRPFEESGVPMATSLVLVGRDQEGLYSLEIPSELKTFLTPSKRMHEGFMYDWDDEAETIATAVRGTENE